LIAHNRNALFLELLSREFPAVDFVGCSKHADLPQALAAHRPHVVFSFKETGMQPALMQPVFDTPSVEWVHLATIGTDHLPPLGNSGVLVSNSGGSGFPPMAEFVVSILLAAHVHLPVYQQQQANRVWQHRAWRPVRGRTILLIGVGWIGKEIARLTRSLGMRVIGIKSRIEPVENVDDVRSLSQLHESLGEADFVSLQVTLTPETRRIMDARAIAAMKPSAWLINIGRGELVDEAALVQALRAGMIGGAALDVFEEEPLPATSPLWTLPDCILTPHSAGWTDDWEEVAYKRFALELRRWLAGETPSSMPLGRTAATV
jgi:phosphoglycerate dehydrogenase-like enzyme